MFPNMNIFPFVLDNNVKFPRGKQHLLDSTARGKKQDGRCFRLTDSTKPQTTQSALDLSHIKYLKHHRISLANLNFQQSFQNNSDVGLCKKLQLLFLIIVY
jgi:hypothetical protein